MKCYSCQEVGHTKKFCPKRNKKGKEQEKSRGEVVVAQDGYESANVLVVSTSEFDKKWILDYGFFIPYDPQQGLVRIIQVHRWWSSDFGE